MLSLEKNTILEKVKAIRTKDWGYIFRGMRILFIPQVKPIGVFVLDLHKDFSALDQYLEEKMPSELRKSLRIQILSDHERSYLKAYLAFRPDFLNRDMVDNILSRGGVVLLVLKDDRIIAATTLVLEEYHLRGGFDLDFLFGPGQVYSCHVYVLPEFRKQGLNIFMTAYKLQYCRQRGYRRMFVAIYPDNKASLKMISRVGYEQYATITLIQQFFTKRHRILTAIKEGGKQLRLRLFGKKEIFI
jgi:L-amino acid N-acyltransferase YncA